MATSADRIAASGDHSVVTTPVGRLAEFSPDTESIEVYIERFEVFPSANNIDELKKAQVFLTVLGEKAYVTLRSLLLPKSPADSKYADITKVLREHYAPRRSIVTEREDMQCRLLSLPNKEATSERVLNIATAMETAKNDTKEILPAPADVNWQNKPVGSQRAKAKQRPQMGLPPENLGSRGKKEFLARGKGKCFRW
ncbi:hypothetical protein MTO96_046121 [Rhipicephalus appendiculatus]